MYNSTEKIAKYEIPGYLLSVQSWDIIIIIIEISMQRLEGKPSAIFIASSL